MEVQSATPNALTVSAIRRSLLLSAVSSLCIPVVSLAGPTPSGDIVAVRVWPAAEYTRVTLEHNSGLRFSHFLATGPDRLVVDIEGVELNAALRELVSKVIPNDPYISAVRVAQNKPRVVRLVFDLKVPINPQMFELAPVADYQHRLVLDIYPTVPQPDPIASLIDDRALQPDAAGGDRDRQRAQQLLEGQGRSAGENGSSRTAPGDRKNSDEAGAQGAAQGGRRPLIIALDPGHGGEDPGAIGPNGTQEKRVVLDIARRLKSRIDAVPGMRAVLTRDGDYFVPLNQRVDKARRAKADLMVSIHADAFIKPEARGASVFALSERGASSTAARWLADNQNAADLIGGVNVRTQDAQLAKVLFDLSTTAQISDSLKVGKAVLQELGQLNTLHKAQVEQAGFAVLKAPDIPSILIETAFISNPDEERRLADEQYQEQLARAIVSGIQRYFQRAGHGLRL